MYLQTIIYIFTYLITVQPIYMNILHHLQVGVY